MYYTCKVLDVLEGGKITGNQKGEQMRYEETNNRKVLMHMLGSWFNT